MCTCDLISPWNFSPCQHHSSVCLLCPQSALGLFRRPWLCLWHVQTPCQNHMIAQGWYIGVAACTRVNASGSRNVHTPCKLQRSSHISAPAQECPWATMQNVPHQQLACTRFCKDASYPSPRSCNKPLRSDSSALFLPPCVLCLLDRERFSWNGLEFHSCIFLPGNFWFWGKKPFLFHQKFHTLRIFIVYVGRLVGCDLVRLLRMYVNATF